MKFEFQSHMGDEVCIVTNIPPEIIFVPVEKHRDFITFYKVTAW